MNKQHIGMVKKQYSFNRCVYQLYTVYNTRYCIITIKTNQIESNPTRSLVVRYNILFAYVKYACTLTVFENFPPIVVDTIKGFKFKKSKLYEKKGI